ncbi:hypothetical protein ACIQC9_04850 [Brevundimonas sp. NPDC092305]|uniref:hypothetical protein n=1 Tax=Brevundimonas sp. NPDC092305 TaxID=3363957 RepID=UPI00382F98DD
MIRGLTIGERALAEEAFGDSLDLDRVRIAGSPWPFNRAFVPGDWFGRTWILWPKTHMPTDASTATLGVQALLIHELTHVWQAQQGVNLLTGKLRAGDSLAAYRYPLDVDCDWATLNIEQQAMVVEHRFLLRRGGRVPADRAFYDRVCPLGARMEI